MSETLTRKQEAISNFEVISIKYNSSANVYSEREVEPLAVYFCQDKWVLIAYCRETKEKRSFVLDRILSFEKTTECTPPHQFEIRDFFK